MKSEKKILIAFLLNLFFAIVEIVGAILTNSVAILSDAVHDVFDLISIIISYFLERKSKKKPDEVYTYGYTRYSVLGALILTVILVISSTVIVYHSVLRIINPVEINYDGMFFIALVGVIINGLAAFLTNDGDSINQKSVSLHMLEDVLGWVIILIGSIVINFTKLLWIDPVMSILVSFIILLGTFKHLKKILDLFLLKKPVDIDIEKLKEELLNINGVKDIHHIHVWSLDGINNFATLHVVTDINVKDDIRRKMHEYEIDNVTIEAESMSEKCSNKHCKLKDSVKKQHHHH